MEVWVFMGLFGYTNLASEDLWVILERRNRVYFFMEKY
jgi:hypothetical protein